MNSHEPLVSICIPTYNRPRCSQSLKCHELGINDANNPYGFSGKRGYNVLQSWWTDARTLRRNEAANTLFWSGG